MIYLDHNATTSVDEIVLKAMSPYWNKQFANPASRTHEMGRDAERAVLQARQTLASIFGIESRYVVFTSGATEANNLVLLGLKNYLKKIGKTKIVTSMFEHKSILDPCEYLKKDSGFEVVLIRPQSNGYVNPDDFRSAISEETGIVSLMHVNNELGTVQPVEEVGEIAKKFGALMHVDGAQGFCKINLCLGNVIDYYTASAHKVHGPKGIGALFINGRKARRELSPIMFGGEHEEGLRPGTLPTPLIVGFAEASLLTRKLFSNKNRKTLFDFSSKLLEALEKTGQIKRNISVDPTLGTTLNFQVKNTNSEALLLRIKDMCLSNGSACSTMTYKPSHVLSAIGLSDKDAQESIRLSINLENLDTDILSRMLQYL